MDRGVDGKGMGDTPSPHHAFDVRPLHRTCSRVSDFSKHAVAVVIIRPFEFTVTNWHIVWRGSVCTFMYTMLLSGLCFYVILGKIKLRVDFSYPGNKGENHI